MTSRCSYPILIDYGDRATSCHRTFEAPAATPPKIRSRSTRSVSLIQRNIDTDGRYEQNKKPPTSLRSPRLSICRVEPPTFFNSPRLGILRGEGLGVRSQSAFTHQTQPPIPTRAIPFPFHLHSRLVPGESTRNLYSPPPPRLGIFRFEWSGVRSFPWLTQMWFSSTLTRL